MARSAKPRKQQSSSRSAPRLPGWFAPAQQNKSTIVRQRSFVCSTDGHPKTGRDADLVLMYSFVF